MRVFLAIIGILFVAESSFAAESYKLVLKEGAISATQLSVKVGDKIEIFHEDTTDAVHKLFVDDGSHDFDLSNMVHGDHFDFNVVKAGTFKIHCHAMKNMEIVVNVSN